MKSTIDLYVADEVRKRRLALHYSQRYLADCLNKSRTFIENVENPKNTTKYNVNHLNEIAKILECSVRDFFPPEPL